MREYGNYAQIRKYDVANGFGIRVSIFCTGCTHKCPGCFNELYQDPNYGEKWTQEQTNLVVEYMKDTAVKGLTLLGGEPFQNTWLVDVIREVKKQTNKEIWAYSGYTYEKLIEDKDRLEMLKECDILIDGPFIQELKDLKLRFRGSSNQRVIDVQKTLETGKVVVLDID
ncbi:anaerobic ribonucleoside-triphosphate reductase activating protein [Helcococcus sueciensis]|uniref:anaerobic ribonucleoside-triphosphate reductase activating protein n=1 Tax=Helcococcus sueciensis TaxID=241555 RepID=UPI000421732E|nr:anaerobic ribonucleoside-triphosphate reductase activating protein [Helcococcus sueciensis]